jgi:hypothetical protein
MKLENIDGFSFDFQDAVEAFKFDETDKTKATYHGATMLKSVDIIVELASAYLFIEIKNYGDPGDFDINTFPDQNALQDKRRHFKWLKNYLKYKYRDSYIYRLAEEKTNKPIHYLCLLNFDNTLNTVMQKALKQELPVGKPSKRWKHTIVASCQVLNPTKWNEVFPKWPVTRY